MPKKTTSDTFQETARKMLANYKELRSPTPIDEQCDRAQVAYVKRKDLSEREIYDLARKTFLCDKAQVALVKRKDLSEANLRALAYHGPLCKKAQVALLKRKDLTLDMLSSMSKRRDLECTAALLIAQHKDDGEHISNLLRRNGVPSNVLQAILKRDKLSEETIDLIIMRLGDLSDQMQVDLVEHPSVTEGNFRKLLRLDKVKNSEDHFRMWFQPEEQLIGVLKERICEDAQVALAKRTDATPLNDLGYPNEAWRALDILAKCEWLCEDAQIALVEREAAKPSKNFDLDEYNERQLWKDVPELWRTKPERLGDGRRIPLDEDPLHKTAMDHDLEMASRKELCDDAQIALASKVTDLRDDRSVAVIQRLKERDDLCEEAENILPSTLKYSPEGVHNSPS